MRLWIHEIYRVFHDRLVDAPDRENLFLMVKSACHEHMRQPIDKILASFLTAEDLEITPSHLSNLMFGNYMEPDADPKVYDEILDFEDLNVRVSYFYYFDLFIKCMILWFQEKMKFYLADYNSLSKTPMSLVLFRYAVEHVSRISRVLQQDNGHALLVGVGGSGRASCTKLAISMAEYTLYTIEMTRTYGPSDWRDDLKALLLRAGADGKPMVFLLSDTQINDESYLEDLSMILNTGDVPNLYQIDEKAEILEKMQEFMRNQAGAGRYSRVLLEAFGFLNELLCL